MLIRSDDLVKDPLVSIIVCSFNRIDLINDTLNSILNQKCDFNYEIIVGDDYSTDNVREKLIIYQRRFPDKIILLFHQKNIGLGANWASCVKIARGRYLAICENDDYWNYHEKLSIQIGFLEQNLEYGMVHSDYIEINMGSGTAIEKYVHKKKYSESIIKSIFYGRFICCNSSVIYRKSVIDKYVNLEDYIKHQFPLCDWNTWILIAKFTKFFCFPIVTTTVRKVPGSITRPSDYQAILNRFENEKKMHAYLCDKFPDDLPFNELYYDIYIYSSLLNLAYLKSDYSKARVFSEKLTEMGSNHFKVIMAKNWVTFKIFFYLKNLKLSELKNLFYHKLPLVSTKN